MKRSHQIRLRPSGRCFDVGPDETILAAATRHAVWLPSRCRNGSCGQCIAQCIEGEICYVARPDVALASGQVCLCTALATSDVELRIEELPERQRHLRSWPAKVVAVTDGADDVIALKLPLQAQSVLSEGCCFDLKAPAPRAGTLTVVSIEPQGRVLVRWQPRGRDVWNCEPSFQPNEILQVDALM